jgi:uncharacterized protein YlxW (UPF0749 family)
MKTKTLLTIVLISFVLLFVVNATYTGGHHVGTVKQNILLVEENQTLTNENQKLTTENQKLTATVDSQATVIQEVSTQLENLTTKDEPIKVIPRNDFDDGEKYNLQPIDLPDDEDN